MRAALNQFFTRRLEHEKAKLPRKIWALKKIIILPFHSYCGLFERDPAANRK